MSSQDDLQRSIDVIEGFICEGFIKDTNGRGAEDIQLFNLWYGLTLHLSRLWPPAEKALQAVRKLEDEAGTW